MCHTTTLWGIVIVFKNMWQLDMRMCAVEMMIFDDRTGNTNSGWESFACKNWDYSLAMHISCIEKFCHFCMIIKNYKYIAYLVILWSLFKGKLFSGPNPPWSSVELVPRSLQITCATATGFIQLSHCWSYNCGLLSTHASRRTGIKICQKDKMLISVNYKSFCLWRLWNSIYMEELISAMVARSFPELRKGSSQTWVGSYIVGNFDL